MPVDLQALKAQAGEALNSDTLQSILPYLISGGAGALVGGMTTGRQKEEKGEGRGEYLTRVLRNAAIAGGLGAGGHYLLNKGFDSTVGGLAQDSAITGGEGNEGPLSTTVKNIAFSPLTALGAGGTALAATNKNPLVGVEGSRNNAVARLREQLPKKGRPSAAALKDMPADDVAKLMAANPGIDDAIRQRAGLPSNAMTAEQGSQLSKWTKDPQKLKGQLSTLLRRGPLSTFGQTHMSRAGRGAIGLAAAGVPALLGAFLTNQSKEAA